MYQWRGIAGTIETTQRDLQSVNLPDDLAAGLSLEAPGMKFSEAGWQLGRDYMAVFCYFVAGVKLSRDQVVSPRTNTFRS
jgi:hypothetical protein